MGAALVALQGHCSIKELVGKTAFKRNSKIKQRISKEIQNLAMVSSFLTHALT